MQNPAACASGRALAGVLGHRATAIAWSTSEEERRKALFAYLSAALPFIIFDNIARGSAISSPSIESALTTEEYQDRTLGESKVPIAPAFTIMEWTGNNIKARGDLSSRTLETRINVNRLDPENREFVHPDPIAWTEAHRGKILKALFTILLGNPRFQETNAPPAQTRFKMWWHLIGSAIENATRNVAAESTLEERGSECPPQEISFASLFAKADDDDEESINLAIVLRTIMNEWPSGASSAEMVQFVNGRVRDENGLDYVPDPEGIAFLAAVEAATSTSRPIKSVSPTVLTWRLKSVQDRPVDVDGKLLWLKFTKGGHGGTFKVEEVPQRHA